ncbi:TadE family protein [Nocardioides sp. TF02-7]|uniref:TadE/TadG family type IV pilus assembly protein n=1 Tax=Nocardioides sp. TF02-7 TaxID=2917724 RepID=UPI001F057DF2|nr:TadE family protein [Nocardioides sp. TF02-7]UMG92263.1 pilus assembly protein [Nocardioides sp. TF02-7]
MRRRDERGSAAIEAAIGVPAFALFVGLIIFGGRTATTHEALQSAAADGARSASLARDAQTARADARAAAVASISNQKIGCSDVEVSVDTDDFNKQPGVPGSVDVTVSCRLNLSDLAVPGVPRIAGHERDHVQPHRHLAGTMSPRRDERGSITVWLALASFVMIFLVGLAVDLGGRVHAHERAHDVAAQAARAGGEEVDGSAAIQGARAHHQPRCGSCCSSALPRLGGRHRDGRGHQWRHHHGHRPRLVRAAIPGLDRLPSAGRVGHRDGSSDPHLRR